MAGRYLAMDYSPVDADIVVSVPESGNTATLGYSLGRHSHGTAFVKNGYVSRYLYQTETEQP